MNPTKETTRMPTEEADKPESEKRHVVVVLGDETVHIAGDTFGYSQDGTLDVVKDHANIASFAPGHWRRAYFSDAIEPS
jgi:hypothetical protein